MRDINGIDDALSCVGEVLGTSGWTEIKQERVNDFADVTDDHQWIHIDTERGRHGESLRGDDRSRILDSLPYPVAEP